VVAKTERKLRRVRIALAARIPRLGGRLGLAKIFGLSAPTASLTSAAKREPRPTKVWLAVFEFLAFTVAHTPADRPPGGRQSGGRGLEAALKRSVIASGPIG